MLHALSRRQKRPESDPLAATSSTLPASKLGINARCAWLCLTCLASFQNQKTSTATQKFARFSVIFQCVSSSCIMRQSGTFFSQMLLSIQAVLKQETPGHVQTGEAAHALQRTDALELLWGAEALPFKTFERHQHLSATCVTDDKLLNGQVADAIFEPLSQSAGSARNSVCLPGNARLRFRGIGAQMWELRSLLGI